MDIKLAEQMLALHLKEEYDFYYSNIYPLIKEAKEIVIPQRIQEAFEELQHNTNLCGDELASYPELSDVIKCWMIDISGEGIKESINVDNINIDFIDQYGNLAHEVTSVIQEEGFIINDICADQSGWDVGVTCTDSEATQLCTFLHEKFKTAIDLDLMSIYKRFLGHRLPNLYDWETLQEWLKTNTLDDEDEARC